MNNVNERETSKQVEKELTKEANTFSTDKIPRKNKRMSMPIIQYKKTRKPNYFCNTYTEERGYHSPWIFAKKQSKTKETKQNKTKTKQNKTKTLLIVIKLKG